MAKKTAKKNETERTELKAHAAKNLFIRQILWHFGKHGKMPKQWQETLEFFGEKCAYCGIEGVKLEKDHAIPANREWLGTSQHGNFVPACTTCNGKKRNKSYEVYCDEQKLRREKNKIAKWPEKCGYVPLAKHEVQAKKVRKILDMACKDIDKLADRYAELLEVLLGRPGHDQS